MRISDWSSDVCSSDLCKKFFRDSRDREAVPLISSARLGCVAAAGDLAVARNGEIHQIHQYRLTRSGRIDEDIGRLKVSMRDPLFVQLLYPRSEEHTSELQSLMRISYAVFCLKKNKT